MVKSRLSQGKTMGNNRLIGAPGVCLGALALLAAGLAGPGCGGTMKRMGATTTADILAEAAPALQEENDPVLAESALLSNIMLMEGLLRVVPEEKPLLRTIAEAYSSYAYAFLEPQTWGDLEMEEEDALRERMKEYHRRARRHAIKRVSLLDEDLGAALTGTQKELEEALEDVDDEDTVDALFWVAHTWGLLIQADLDDLESVAARGTVETIMGHVRSVSPEHEYGLPVIFAGVSQAMQGAGLGGDMEAAKKDFDEAMAMNDGAFLLATFLYGRYYCVATNDEACFKQAMQRVIEADPNALMARRLVNTLAQQWAKTWMEIADEQLF